MSHPSVGHTIIRLLEEHHLLSAPELVTKLHDQGKNVNKTSVYRAIDKLLATDQICKLHFRDNDIVYELRGHHHDHLVCENCGKIKIVECALDIPSMKEGYTISHHHLMLYGVCSDCQT